MRFFGPLSSFIVICIASHESDLAHMSRCLPAVRSFISEGGDSVDWLFERAEEDADVVLLYMIRMCFFFHERYPGPHSYDAKALFGRVTSSVPSFTDSEFKLLSEAVHTEMISQKPFEELFNPLPGDTDFFTRTFDSILIPVLGMIFGLAIPALLYMHRQNGLINRTKQQ